MIRAVSFDYGGVLNHGGTANVIRQRVCHGLDVSQDRFSEVEGEVAKLYRGKISPEDFWQECARVMDIRLRPDHLQRWFELDVNELEPKFYAFAKQLRDQGIQTAVLSNISSMSIPAIRKIGGYDGFSPVLLSCEVGYAKPDSQFYQMLVDQLNLLPHEIVHLDDQQYCLDGAAAVGMAGIKVTSADDAIKQVNELLKAK